MINSENEIRNESNCIDGSDSAGRELIDDGNANPGPSVPAEIASPCLSSDDRSFNRSSDQPGDAASITPQSDDIEAREVGNPPALVPSEEPPPVEEVAPELPVFVWDRDAPPGPETWRLTESLAGTGEIFVTPEGRIMQLKVGQPARQLDNPTALEGFIRSRFSVRVIRNGELKSTSIPSGELRVLLESDGLKRKLPVVDCISSTPTYTSDSRLTEPGYNCGDVGDRIFYIGEAVVPKRKAKRIRQFLNAMSFSTEADRTNAVGLALTVLLRHLWPGAKPFAAVTANMSHAGKDTVIDFAAGKTMKEEISWHEADWATQIEMFNALSNPNTGVLVVGNCRLGARGCIASSILERTVTAPTALLQSSKARGSGKPRAGDFVIMASANDGRFSTDLANRSLPIHLEQIGDIATRVSPIGNPRLEFLPTYRDEIEAELLGMIENWIDAGKPLDESVRHPMDAWAKTIGGILMVNGFEHFLENYSTQNAVNDPIREALGILAHVAPHDDWIGLEQILDIVRSEGLLNAFTERRHRGSDQSIIRQLGKVLTTHQRQTLIHQEDGEEQKHYQIEKSKRPLTPHDSKVTVYAFGGVEAPTSSIEPNSDATPAEGQQIEDAPEGPLRLAG